MMRYLYVWLLESDLPVGLQIFWKLLTGAMTGMLIYAGTQCPTYEGQIVVTSLSFFTLCMCLFTKLGDG